MIQQGVYWDCVRRFDEHLDGGVGETYKEQPLAQDWARVSKVAEELGEAINELILLTGQNPRKPQDHTAYERLLAELADVVLTATYAIQHFTKEEQETRSIIEDRLIYHGKRVGLLP